MTLPNPRTIYEVDPTGREDRAIVSRGLRTSSGIETVVAAGFFQWKFVIITAANRHAMRQDHIVWTGTGAPRHA